MSFLGYIGHLMGGSGELLELGIAANTVNYILSGKAVARAVRGHLLVDAALNCILCTKAISKDPSEQDINEEVGEQIKSNDRTSTQFSNNSDVRNLSHLMEQALSGKISTAQLDNNSDLVAFRDKSIENLKTPKLWIQYLRLIDTLGSSKANALENDLSTCRVCMICYHFFAKSGHNLYLKSVYLHLQKMSTLEKQHPDVYQQFCSGPACCPQVR